MVTQDTSGLKSIFRLNWFKIFLILVIGYVVIQKDFSLNFDLNAPLEEEVEMPSQKPKHPSHKTSDKRKRKKEKLTEATPVKKAEPSKGTSLFNFFDNPFGGGNTARVSHSYKTELDKIDEVTKQGYLKRFSHVAVNEQKKFNIPASIVLANALLHSCSGKSELAEKVNNHFAVECGNDWTSATAESNGRCYRNYETAWMSFRDHSNYISSGKFSHLKEIGTSDYKAWAKGLEKANFSKERNLAKSLIRIIEQYGLDDLDRVNP